MMHSTYEYRLTKVYFIGLLVSKFIVYLFIVKTMHSEGSADRSQIQNILCIQLISRI